MAAVGGRPTEALRAATAAEAVAAMAEASLWEDGDEEEEEEDDYDEDEGSWTASDVTDADSAVWRSLPELDEDPSFLDVTLGFVFSGRVGARAQLATNADVARRKLASVLLNMGSSETASGMLRCAAVSAAVHDKIAAMARDADALCTDCAGKSKARSPGELSERVEQMTHEVWRGRGLWVMF